METLTLRKGEQQMLALPGHGSAGYQWSMVSADAGIVSVEEILNDASEASGALQGSLDQRFQLTALAPGETCIRFVLIRRFAPGEPQSTHEIALTVIADGQSAA
ncbi:protease inhibitor I42 family protein [Paracidobacterium acidisoli]|uniref:Proteinase inhibitor I42 chagasin domain-containing protein n=1 Tax=Paracidobacterium acidisoli TaxID=2303751 RepID=A0A372IRH2_9BACT|nr:protease inhibitor I42 family protein [Paracidobacterium acidisoli]MBT9330402.1 protease inhibitor I42 family protein [Paracidobacterium acidisoli]